MTNSELRLLTALRESRTKWAEAAMDYPKAETFEHGVQVGVYRGLGMAADALEAIIREEEQKEERQ